MDFPGLTFSPTDQNISRNPTDPNAQSAPQGYAPIQDAIRTLSFKIPKFGGAPSPIPQGLLSGAGMGGIDLQGILRSLFGLQQPTMGNGGQGATPNVYPGAGAPPPPVPWSRGGDTTLPGASQLPNGPAPGTYNPGGYDPSSQPSTPPPQGPMRPPLGGIGAGPWARSV